MFFSTQYIKISIKPHSEIVLFFTEAHIYLPYENLAPGHFIFPPFEELSTFYNIELKSLNNNFQIPIFTDNLFFLTPNSQPFNTITTPITNIQTAILSPNTNLQIPNSFDPIEELCYNKFLKKI